MLNWAVAFLVLALIAGVLGFGGIMATSVEIAKILLENIGRKTEVIYDKLDRKIKPSEIHFSSTRGGVVNFSHTIGFDGASDTITINHTARDRGGYAIGAIKVAEWMNGKKGFYNMEDFLNN